MTQPGDVRRGLRGADQGAVDLAARRGARRRPDRAAQEHDRLRQQPPAGRAADGPAQRDRHRARDGRERSPEPHKSPAEIIAQSGSSRGIEAVIAKAHHGSVSKEQRALIEDDLKRGRLPAVVATSSLELGIDMGAVDLVIQIESPPSVASALQRVGRAGHQVGEVSRGVLFPKHRGDLAQTAVAVQRMRSGAIESLRVPTNPLDVLAQQVVAATAMDGWPVDDLFDLMKRTASFAQLPRSAYDAVLDLLSGRYPSDEFAELRPRIVWDRVTGTLTGRPGAQRLAVTSGGTIPDRGLFGVFLVGGRVRGARQAGGRARRGDGLRVPGRRRVRARRDQLADRGHHPRPGPGHPGPRRTRPAAVLEGRRPRPPGRARRGGRRLHPRAGGDAEAPGRAARHGGGARLLRRRQPGRLPPRAARGHPGAAQRPDPAGRAVPRRARRLAAGRALPLRHARPRALGAGHQRPAARALRHRRPGRGLRRRHRDPDPRHRRRGARRRGGGVLPRRDRRPRHPGGRRLGAVRLAVPRVRGPRAAAPAPRPRPAQPAVAAAPAQRGAARGRQPLPVVPDRPRGGPRVPPGRLRPARPGRADALGRAAQGPGHRRLDPEPDRRSRAACSSATSPSSSTRATPPSPSAGPPRSRSTRGCSPSCWAAPSCASCSTPRCWPSSRPSYSGSRPSAGPGAPRASPTCSGCSARSAPTRCRSAAPRASTAARRSRPWPPRGAWSRSGSPASSAGPRSRTSAGSATGSASPSRPAPPTRSPTPSTTRWPTWSPATPAPTGRSPPTTSPSGSASAPPWSGSPSSGSAPRAGCSTASSGRERPGWSGATPRCCGRCGGGAWPGCARRWSRSRRPPWAGSSAPGSTSAASSAASTAWSR